MLNEKPKQKNSDKRSRNWLAGFIFAGLLLLSAAYLWSQIKPFPVHFARPNTVITPDNAQQIRKIASFEIAQDEGVQFSADGQLIMLATRSGARLIDVNEGKEILRFEDEDSVCATGICDLPRTYFPSNTFMAALSPDGTMLALGIKRGTLDEMHVWNAHSGLMLKSFGSDSGLVALAFSPDNSLLIYSSFGGTKCTGLCAWHIQTGEIFQIDSLEKRAALEIEFEKPVELVFTPDSSTLIYAAPDITSYNLQTREAHILDELNAPATALLLSPENDLIYYILGYSNYIHALNIETGQSVHTYVSGFVEEVYQLDLTPDGRRLIASGRRIWDTAVHEELFELASPSADCCGDRTAVSPDSRILAKLVSGYLIMLYDIQAGEEVAMLQGNYNRSSCCIAFSPDGTMLVTSSGEIYGIPD